MDREVCVYGVFTREGNELAPLCLQCFHSAVDVEKAQALTASPVKAGARSSSDQSRSRLGLA